jgi:hypothetical protein
LRYFQRRRIRCLRVRIIAESGDDETHAQPYASSPDVMTSSLAFSGDSTEHYERLNVMLGQGFVSGTSSFQET